MLCFNKLNYFTIPSLPAGWRPPAWPTIELGIFSGRLYFEYEEYGDVCAYLVVKDVAGILAEVTDEARVEISEPDEFSKTNVATRSTSGRVNFFIKRPLTFLQEWLAVRRKGQDFTHTPMGYICQGKGMSESHPFFNNARSGGSKKIDSEAKCNVSSGGISPDRRRNENNDNHHDISPFDREMIDSGRLSDPGEDQDESFDENKDFGEQGYDGYNG